jgi:hypothetical protein
MTILTRCSRILALAVFAAVLSAQAPADTPELAEPKPLPGLDSQQEGVLNRGQRKIQREAILKLEQKKNLEDVARLLELTQSLKSELEKSNRNLLSVSSVRKAEQIEKLARSIRSRLKRFWAPGLP